MIAYIKGKVIDNFDGGVVLENNGIGYEIFCSATALTRLSAKGEGGVYTYFQVKEDGVCLYGFATSEEKDLFLKLITVSGVGPKGAIGILSNISMQDLIKAISLGDIKVLSSIKGIGKKTAERIAIELKDKVTFEGSFDVPEQIVDTKAVDEAITVLVSLGVSKNDALRLAREYAKEDSTAEEIVSKALRGLGN